MYSCINCDWIGDEDSVEISRDGDAYDPKTNFEYICPRCGFLCEEVEEFEPTNNN